jgi:hypothetical protein
LKIEYLPGINSDYPEDDLIRLFDFDQNEAGRFQKVIEQEILKGRKAIELSSLDFIHSVNCSLRLILGDKDFGIRKIKIDKFECELSAASYRKMLSLIQPFLGDDLNGYQWLYDTDPKTSQTELLFSPGGTW